MLVIVAVKGSVIVYAMMAAAKPESAAASSIGTSRCRRMMTVISAMVKVMNRAARSPRMWPPPNPVEPPTVMTTPAPATRLPIRVRRSARSRNHSQAMIAVMKGSVA